MRIFDKLTGGGVEWQIELDNASGAFQPEAVVSGRVRFTPEHQIDVRATKVALVGSEHFVYSVRRASSGRNRGSTRQNQWFDEELFRQQLDLTGAASFTAGASTEFPFQFQLPQGALPSFESNVLRMRWYVRAWMDVGGNDPDAERELNVTPPPGTLQASGEALAAISGDGTCLDRGGASTDRRRSTIPWSRSQPGAAQSVQQPDRSQAEGSNPRRRRRAGRADHSRQCRRCVGRWTHAGFRGTGLVERPADIRGRRRGWASV